MMVMEITIDHIMASGTIPIFYKFREIGGRKFCDGGFKQYTIQGTFTSS